MDKPNSGIIIISYMLYVLFVSWITMLTLGAFRYKISYALTISALLTARLVYTVVKGSFASE
tara:strand:- start:438 stop:623 length:186 start_codon:yes stop_codon:yes gene_type:complete